MAGKKKKKIGADRPSDRAVGTAGGYNEDDFDDFLPSAWKSNLEANKTSSTLAKTIAETADYETAPEAQASSSSSLTQLIAKKEDFETDGIPSLPEEISTFSTLQITQQSSATSDITTSELIKSLQNEIKLKDKKLADAAKKIKVAENKIGYILLASYLFPLLD